MNHWSTIYGRSISFAGAQEEGTVYSHCQSPGWAPALEAKLAE